MLRFSLLCSAAVLGACVATPASAFGLRMHLYIADQVYSDAADCEIVLPQDKRQRLPDRICTALSNRENRGYFLAGALGPDVFPDILIGQTFVHPGTRNGRQAADWLEAIMSQASSDAEVAFAYGLMVHASSDIFAHSYVNNYAGGVFEPTRSSSKDIELRHFELEKYIDLAELKVPAGLLVKSMVRTSYIPEQLDIDNETLTALFSNPNQTLGRILAEKFASAAPAAHMTAMWATMVIAENAAVTSPCNEIQATRRMASAFRLYVEAERYARGEGRKPPTRTRRRQGHAIRLRFSDRKRPHHSVAGAAFIGVSSGPPFTAGAPFR